MQSKKLPWRRAYLVVEPGIRSDGVRIYPFDASFPVGVGFHIFAGPHNVRMNRHDHLEVLYIYGGKTRIQVQDRCFRVKEGDLLALGPDLYHRILNGPPGTEVRVVSLNFRPEVIRGGELCEEAEEYLMPFLCQDSKFPHVIRASTAVPPRALELIMDVHRELPAGTSLARLAVRTYMKMILLLLAKHYKAYLGPREEFGRRERQIQRLHFLFQFLEENYGRHIKIADAAQKCAMSSSYFMRFFKAATGESFISYLSGFRIAKAQMLLATTKEPIAQVSESLAFCTQSYFGKVFRSMVGITPLAYRQRFGRENQSSVAPPSTI